MNSNILLDILQFDIDLDDLFELRDENEFAAFLESKGVAFSPDDLYDLKEYFESGLSGQSSNNCSGDLSSLQLDLVAGGACLVGNEDVGKAEICSKVSTGIGAAELAVTIACLGATVLGGVAAGATIGMLANSFLGAGQIGTNMAAQHYNAESQA